jgi:hypothetical protein
MISDLRVAPAPRRRFLVAAPLPLHHILVQGPIAWRVALVVADVPIVEAAMVIVMRIDLLTVKLVHLQGVKMLLHIFEVKEVRVSEHPPGRVIESGRVNGTGSLAGKDMVKEIVTEKERRSVIGTGIEIGKGRETRTRTKNVIVATGTETVTEIETGIETVTAGMRRIVTETRGKIGNLLGVVPPPLRHLLPSILVI